MYICIANESRVIDILIFLMTFVAFSANVIFINVVMEKYTQAPKKNVTSREVHATYQIIIKIIFT